MAQTQCSVVVEGETVDEILSFDYSSDVMTLGEEAHFTVDNKDKKYRDLLQIGQRVEFRLSNPDVNGGAPTVKHRGRIVRRNPKVSPSEGSVINVTSADLGWHLMNSHSPLWVSFRGKTLADLCDPTKAIQVGRDGTQYYFVDPSWGFKGVRFDGDIRRKLKLGVAAIQSQLGAAFTIAEVVQSTPGLTPATAIGEYAARENLLLNVSPDGFLCLFKPADSQAPLYSLRLWDGDPLNNVLEAEAMEDATTRYTEVEDLGDQLGPQFAVGTSVNAKKTRGSVSNPAALPFVHRHTVGNNETYTNELCQRAAEWIARRGMFDAFYATYSVSEHHQNGSWWESDTVAEVLDDELGLYGNYYVQAVRCQGSKGGGDTTQVTIRQPGLLSASFDRTKPKFGADSVKGEIAF